MRDDEALLAELERLGLPADAPAQADALPLPLLFASDIRATLDTADIVQGVLIEKTAVVIYGESNSGKTFWTTDLALSIAAGIAWNGRRVEQSGAIYVVMEGGRGFKNRVAAWLAAHDIDADALPFATVPASLNLLDPTADTPRLIATIKRAAAQMAVPVRLVVVDTLSRALAGGNENASECMGALVANMDRIRAETGAVLAFVHHSGKDAARGARGHSLLRAAVDTEIEVVDREGERTATVVKQRDLPKGAKFGFRLRVHELGHNRHGEPVTSCTVEHMEAAPTRAPGRPLPAQARIVLDRLHAVTAAQGEALPGTSGFPTSATRGVRQDTWRNAAYDALGHLATESRCRAYSRAVEVLAARRLIGQHAGWAWPVAQTEATS